VRRPLICDARLSNTLYIEILLVALDELATVLPSVFVTNWTESAVSFWLVAVFFWLDAIVFGYRECFGCNIEVDWWLSWC
jgi:hypothetical protein